MARREALFLSFRFAPFNLDIHIVGIFALFFVDTSAFKEPTRIFQFKLSLFFEEISVYLRKYFFDFVLGFL
jgi:hypothetical protein